MRTPISSDDGRVVSLVLVITRGSWSAKPFLNITFFLLHPSITTMHSWPHCCLSLPAQSSEVLGLAGRFPHTSSPNALNGNSNDATGKHRSDDLLLCLCVFIQVYDPDNLASGKPHDLSMSIRRRLMSSRTSEREGPRPGSGQEGDPSPPASAMASPMPKQSLSMHGRVEGGGTPEVQPATPQPGFATHRRYAGSVDSTPSAGTPMKLLEVRHVMSWQTLHRRVHRRAVLSSGMQRSRSESIFMCMDACMPRPRTGQPC